MCACIYVYVYIDIHFDYSGSSCDSWIVGGS